MKVSRPKGILPSFCEFHKREVATFLRNLRNFGDTLETQWGRIGDALGTHWGTIGDALGTHRSALGMLLR